jgi:hypothetical protein
MNQIERMLERVRKIQAGESVTAQPSSSPTTTEKFIDEHHWPLMVLSYVWALPWVAAGLLLCASIVGFPLGMLAFAIGGWPLSVVQKRAAERTSEWEQEDRPMPNSSTPPWLMEDEEPDA